jgi:hypothetical protein
VKRLIVSAVAIAILALAPALAVILWASDADTAVSLGWLAILLDVVVFGVGGFVVALGARGTPLVYGAVTVALAFVLQWAVLMVASSNPLGGADGRDLLIADAIVLLPAGLFGVATASLLRRLLARAETRGLQQNRTADDPST